MTSKNNKVVPNSEVVEKKTLQKRSSSVYSLMSQVQSMRGRERQGTILFIAATLLQRELVETIVPLQALGVVSVLYVFDVKSNSVTSSWSGSDEYFQTLMYTGIDLGIELLVFTGTIFVLKRMFPELSPFRILSGLINVNFISMFMIITCAWLAFLLFQSSLSGMDTTFRFDWLQCQDKENSTWLGGYDWDC